MAYASYHLTRSINHNIFNFALLFGRMSMLDSSMEIMSSVIEEILKKSALAAVSIDKNIFEKIELSSLHPDMPRSFVNEWLRKEFIAYASTKLDIVKKVTDIDAKFIKEVHNHILPNEKSNFRRTKRILPKEVTQNSVVKQIQLEVKTAPNQIKEQMKRFLDWLQKESYDENPVIVAGIAHFKIAEIHPYDDGNGRLGRLMEYAVMKSRGLDITDYIATEAYYLHNSERYYELIESSIESKNLTGWLEFYTEALLSSVMATAKIIYKNSGGSIDLINNKIFRLNEMELKIIDLMRRMNQPSPSEIAEVMGTSRQNVYYFLRGLHQKGILIKTGKNTGARYRLKMI